MGSRSPSRLARTVRAIAALAILAAGAPALAQTPQAPGTVKANHGAWSIVCDQPAGASGEQCALMQNVIAEDRPEVGLSVVILKTADRKAKILRVLAPLGVLLPNGLGLNVDGKDIGQVAVGQPVRLKFDAFPFQKFGTAAGIVRVVSQDSFAPDPKVDGQRSISAPYYRVLVDVENARLRGQPAQIQMIPGMAVTAEMKIGRRSVISYFVYPLLRGLDESIREP